MPLHSRQLALPLPSASPAGSELHLSREASRRSVRKLSPKWVDEFRMKAETSADTLVLLLFWLSRWAQNCDSSTRGTTQLDKTMEGIFETAEGDVWFVKSGALKFNIVMMWVQCEVEPRNQ